MRNNIPCLLLLAGCSCAVNPSVRYQRADSPQNVQAISADLIDSYVLQKNELRIEFKKSADKDKPAGYDLSVTDNRLEDPDYRLMVLRNDRLWARTTFNIAKVENTDLIDSAGVEVADRRVELIQNVGTILKTVLPFAAAVSDEKPVPGCETSPAAPCILVPSDTLLAMKKDAGSVGQKVGLKLFWGAIPNTAMATDDLFASLNKQKSNGVYYSACREFRVRLVNGTGSTSTIQEWRGKIADPRWVEFVAFPRKGKIRMHAQCGVSTTSEADPTKSPDEVAAAAVAQAVAVKEAIDKANADAKKK
jgi:hypothetical protein